MKYFIVNVNKCLKLSQYAPFFYEHIYDGDLVILDDIENTCQLDKTYLQLVSHLNRNPFAYQKSVIMLFIDRDFSRPLQAQDYELYNDIHIYNHLLRKLSSNFKVYTFYVDRTGEALQNDPTYLQLRTVSKTLQAEGKPELAPYFLSLERDDAACSGSFKDFLRERISRLSDCTRPFYLQMLDKVSDMQGTPAAFQNGLNNYIGEARRHLSGVEHIYAPVYWLDIAIETKEWFKIIYYIKEMIAGKREPMAYKDYSFDRYDEVRRLIATYRKRLESWSKSTPEISKKGAAEKLTFRETAKAAEEYHNKVNELITKELGQEKKSKKSAQKPAAGKIGQFEEKSIVDQKSVDRIFEQLRKVISDAKGQLEDFCQKQSAFLLEPSNYQKVGMDTFDRDKTDREELQQEAEQLSQMNQFGTQALDQPDFSEENKLVQELDIDYKQIIQIITNQKECRKTTFLGALLFALLAVASLYLGAQYSIFLKENSWWIFLAYMAVVGVVFATAYFVVLRKFRKEIEKLIRDSKEKVSKFLQSYKEQAAAFEKNTLAAGKYYCLKHTLDAKRADREAYQLTMQQYAWHKMKVDQLLRDLTFFNGFVGKASVYEESAVTFDDFTHDPEHTEFYLMKVIRK
ncbi:MAG: hypothetical protein E7447_00545 [Ruminococcaceae bacterium]|nr:hypothetical protein [Oscillospiraceae bacterium]